MSGYTLLRLCSGREQVPGIALICMDGGDSYGACKYCQEPLPAQDPKPAEPDFYSMCVCGRPYGDHYSLLREDGDKRYCRKRAPYTFVAMPDVFKSKEAQKMFDALVQHIVDQDEVPSKVLHAVGMAAVEWDVVEYDKRPKTAEEG